MRFCLILCFLLSLTACEENRIEPTLYGSIKATVVEDASGLPLVGATVTTSPASDVQVTDATGQCTFDQVVVGSISVRAEFTGYITNTEALTIAEADTAQVVLRMRVTTTTNQLPAPPSYLSPANNSTDLSRDTVLLRWRRAVDPDAGATLTYTVLLFQPGQNTDTIALNITDTTTVLTNLEFQTSYSWQVVTQDTSKTSIFGQVWHFDTKALPNNPILFARNTAGFYHIWSALPNGSGQVQLTHQAGNQWRPRRNNQRTRIAFLADSGITTGLYSMANDGSDVRLATILPIVGGPDRELDFAWSPDGSKLLFMSGNKLFTVHFDGSGLALFATAPASHTWAEADWSATSNQILARAVGTSVFESIIQRFTVTGMPLGDELTDRPGTEGGPEFALTGDRYLYTIDSSGLNSADGRQLNAQIFIRTTGTTPAQLNVSFGKIPGTNDIDARFSANGGQIIFVNTDNTGTGIPAIWTMSALGFNRQVLIQNAEMPDWR